MSSVEGVCWERHEQRVSTSSEEEKAWQTTGLKQWGNWGHGKLRRMEPRMVKNNNIVHLIWHSTGILNLLPLKTLLSFQKWALHVIVLIAADHPGPLSFCPAAPIFFTSGLVVATKSSAYFSLHPCLMQILLHLQLCLDFSGREMVFF